ncbi:O-methyltransferase [Bacillus carboniphilus]|uniref:tRNA 5-hydroxyuridine methyltransferase n=1 Tax=Bacillus carboniphilus TaxID=86663 RepID=A0ABY9JXC2_9BACI|nr:O-methyltransferase [Bacillus carboniphilus]WLR44031.1 O-methyltransferase [Bacillus carboniphilus]
MQDRTAYQYIESLMKNLPQSIEQLQYYAKQHHVPIMDKVSIEVLLLLLQLYKPKKILEIGTAIGYSSMRMAMAFNDVKITTIERDQDRFEKAVSTIKQNGLSDRIDVINGDALSIEVQTQIDHGYDLLFIDAAKGQYQRFLDIYEMKLLDKSIIIVDNVFLGGLIFKEDDEIPRRKRTMVRNLKAFNKALLDHPHYDTTIIPVGDGMAVSVKRGV